MGLRTFDVSEVDSKVPGHCHFSDSVISVQITAGPVKQVPLKGVKEVPAEDT